MSDAGRIKNKTLSTRIVTAPTTIQNLRAKIIKNAVEFARQLADYKFNKLSEIIRVCTALGVERAFLRGLQHPITSEIDIDRFLYRFDLKGAVPFVDQNTFLIDPKKVFFSQSENTLMLFCLNNESNTFIKIDSNTAYFEADVDPDEIQTEVIAKRILPSFSFIPKYRNLGTSATQPWLPTVDCNFFNNIPDANNCLETIDVAQSSTIPPEPNMLIPINVNPFPYLTPNGSLPFNKVVYPEPRRLRMVLDGFPIENEEVILANRFELTGNIFISAGDDVNVKISPSDEINDYSVVEFFDIDDLPIGGTLRTEDETIPISEPPVSTDPLTFIVPGTYNYYGNAVYVRDPILGENTKFTEELFVNDVIEIVNERQRITGKFYTIGDEYVYYLGTEFVDFYSNYSSNQNFELRVQFNDIKYTLIQDASNENSTATKEVNISNRKFSYNGKYKISSKEIIGDIPSTIFDALSSVSVTFVPDPINSKKGVIEINDPTIAANIRDYFEVGEPVILSNVLTNTGTETNVEFVFGGILDGKLIRCFSLDLHDMSRSFTTRLTRAAKPSKFLLDYTYGTLDPYRLYFKVTRIDSDTEIEVSPPFADSVKYSGKINRIGFNIRSASQNPGLIAEGLGVDGAVQFLRRGSFKNSETFFMPAARTNKVILYHAYDAAGNQITTTGSVVSATATTVNSSVDALVPYQFTPFDYSTFTPPLGSPVYEIDYFQGSIYNNIDDEDRGILYFTDDEQEFITLETLDDYDSPVAHGFAENDILYIRKIKYSPAANEDPYGTLVDPANEAELDIDDYEKCGLQIPVIEVINPYRFTIDKESFTGASDLSAFFQRYNESSVEYLSATNGLTLEFWSKYFDAVYLDGTLTANAAGEYISPVNDNPRILELMQKGTSASLYKPNYLLNGTTLNYYYGSTPVEISVTGNKFVDVASVTETQQGVFLFSINTREGNYPVGDIIPADLLDVFQLRAVEFSVETEYIP